jgi:hypothetical protein
MCVVPGPASQDVVIIRVYASPGLQCVSSPFCFHDVAKLGLVLHQLEVGNSGDQTFWRASVASHLIIVLPATNNQGGYPSPQLVLCCLEGCLVVEC